MANATITKDRVEEQDIDQEIEDEQDQDELEENPDDDETQEEDMEEDDDHDAPPEPIDEDIQNDYNDLLDREKLARHRWHWWEKIMTHEYMEALIAEIQEEIDERKLSWEHIKPKDFALDQARVHALTKILGELTNRAERMRDEANSLNSQKVSMQNAYPLLLQQQDHTEE